MAYHAAMQNLDLIITITAGLAAALACGYITFRLGLSPIVGYLLAGLAVGPHSPGFVADLHIAEQLAEIGVILLMFGVGLEFHLSELLAVRRVAIPGAVAQSAAATVLGSLVAVSFGWSWSTGLVFGLALSVASTVVLMRVLIDNRELHTPTGHVAVGWLVVEDIFTVFILVLLPSLVSADAAGWRDIPITLGMVALKIGILVGFTALAGSRAIPWLLNHAAITRSRELFTLTVLVIAMGIAVGCAMLLGISMALGAFLAGMVVGRSDFSHRAATEALPMRDAFAVLFFVSVGMMLDPQQFLDAPGLILATLGVVLIGKPAAALAITLFFRMPLRTSLAIAVALSQIGEFSFILGAVATQLGIFNDEVNRTLVAVSIVSITLNPILYRMVGTMEQALLRKPPVKSWINKRMQQHLPPQPDTGRDFDDADIRHRAVVVGYGPVGQTVTRLLRENQIEPTVIELNIDTTRHLREDGVQAVYGDASKRETLKAAGIERAGSIILSASGITGSDEVIRAARELNPRIQVLARSAYIREVAALRQVGADRVYAGESEVALALTTEILRRVGATPEQIDRERERVHIDLLGMKMKPSRTGGREQMRPPMEESALD